MSTRRQALTAIAAAPVATVPALAHAGFVDPHVAWLARRDACRRQRDDTFNACTICTDEIAIHDRLAEELFWEMDELECKIRDTPARTAQGHAAKLRIAADDFMMHAGIKPEWEDTYGGGDGATLRSILDARAYLEGLS